MAASLRRQLSTRTRLHSREAKLIFGTKRTTSSLLWTSLLYVVVVVVVVVVAKQGTKQELCSLLRWCCSSLRDELVVNLAIVRLSHMHQ